MSNRQIQMDILEELKGIRKCLESEKKSVYVANAQIDTKGLEASKISDEIQKAFENLMNKQRGGAENTKKHGNSPVKPEVIVKKITKCPERTIKEVGTSLSIILRSYDYNASEIQEILEEAVRYTEHQEIVRLAWEGKLERGR